MNIGLTVASLAVALGVGRAAWEERDVTLPGVLLGVWAVPFGLLAADARMATFVFTAAVLDMVIGAAALLIVTRDPSRYDARVVGGISMAIMPAHWMMSVSNGTANWTIYAIACNTAFVAQCLIAGGWFDGMGRRISRFIARLRPVHSLRDGGE